MREIFVFGSNLAGRHGKGAAKYAVEHYGAQYGVGVGLQGDSYAIPTKDKFLNPLSLKQINYYVDLFIKFAGKQAFNNSDMVFKVMPIGTGLAGYKIEDIAPMFKAALRLHNINLCDEFLFYFNKPKKHSFNNQAYRLSDEQKDFILLKTQEGWSQGRISREIGVTQPAISYFLRRI